MGRKSKAQQYDLVELIVSKHDGGKNTVVYVTDEVNRWLEENGLKIKFSRESIRRVIKTHEEEVLAAKESIEAAKAMAEILKDNPGTEATEAVVMTLASLIGKEIRQIEELSFDDPSKLVTARSVKTCYCNYPACGSAAETFQQQNQGCCRLG